MSEIQASTSAQLIKPFIFLLAIVQQWPTHGRHSAVG